MKTIVIILAIIIFACITGRSIRIIERPEPAESEDEIDWTSVKP